MHPKVTIYIFALIMQISGMFIYSELFSNEITIYDPRYEQLAANIIQDGTLRIEWGVGNNQAQFMQHPYEIQKGVYYNWFPIGYSLILVPTMLFDNYKIVLTIFQLFLFSFIPVLLFLISNQVFRDYKYRVPVSFLISILWCFYPYYLVSSLWRSDTWTIVLLNLITFYNPIKFYDSGFSKKYAYRLAFLFVTLFFFRPLILFPYGLLIFIWVFMYIKDSLKTKNLFVLLVTIVTVVGIWTIKNYVEFNVVSFTHSNVGYNLWLGNNKYTNEFMRKRLGDGATIEDEIITKYDKEWAFLKYYSEYEKDNFFRERAYSYMKNHPIETIENSFWKIIGFWSPLRMRTGHWSDSKAKQIFILIVHTPLLILSLLSLITYFKRKEYKKKVWKTWLILFMFLYMLPHLLFFSTTRFRAPIDFSLLLLSMDYLYPSINSIISKFKLRLIK